ncbi:MAG: hypothetical protein WDM84_06130 [Bauldia sp.]
MRRRQTPSPHGSGPTGRPVVNGELTSALDGNWPAVAAKTAEKIKAAVATRGAEISDGAVSQATRDSVRALMMIRAYRMRGHFHANLDPLQLESVGDEAELDPASYGFTRPTTTARFHRQRAGT